jgi:hypothetical protein
MKAERLAALIKQVQTDMPKSQLAQVINGSGLVLGMFHSMVLKAALDNLETVLSQAALACDNRITKHNHAICTTPAERPSTIVNILSRWHYDFPRKDAQTVLKEHYELFHNRGSKTALETAQEIISAAANATDQ